MFKERFKFWMVVRERKGKMDYGDYEEEDSVDVFKVLSLRIFGYASLELEWEEKEISYKSQYNV